MRYLFGFLAAVGLIVAVFILLLRGLGGRGTPVNQINLADYTTSDTVMQLTLDGPINADSLHQSFRITVGRTEATIDMMQGYDGRVVSSTTYENTEQAYATFLRALQLLNYTKGNADPARADERGQCPNRDRYVFGIISHGRKVQRYWSTSCGKGTFGGNDAQVRRLFIGQIPDFSKITKGFKY